MDGMLSQDEINALLNGMSDGSINPDDLQTDNGGVSSSETGLYENTAPVSEDDATLTDVEKDAIGEIANISMGSAATTLYSLVNRKVDITTPVVSLARWDTMVGDYERPCVFIQIKYTAGLDGHNILILKEQDVKIITDLMMGGDGTNTDGELTEIHLSAISEAMNQMMGASATSLATMLGKMVDISPPEATLVDLMSIDGGAEIAPFLGGTFVKINFRMKIGDLVDSTIMQLYPCEFAKYLCTTFMGGMGEPEPEPAPVPQPDVGSSNMGSPNMGMQDSGMGNPNMGNPNMGNPNMGSMMGTPGMDMSQMGGMNPYGAQNMGNPGMGNPNMGSQNYGMPMMGNQGMAMPPYGNPYGYGMPAPQQPVNIQPAQFQSFTGNSVGAEAPSNIDLIMDVSLDVTVELGHTRKSISEVLDFAPGTIIELDKIAGEPVEVLVNGKLVAKGEVVVIEESFGVRVTEIIK